MRQRAAPERGERVSTAEDRTWSMSALFIASRRVLVVGRTRGGSPLIQVCALFGDLQATGTREAAVIAGRPKWLAEASARETGT
jgi:hypothetical protein